uniref:Spondin domain-containing protein n=1 Tax=Timema shepardi TaxID=629360 RepID=A0A7R9AMN1_TIMSH|nr:unnamed protein product [Timema shepardi]
MQGAVTYLVPPSPLGRSRGLPAGMIENLWLGRSHDGSFVLFRLGTRASSGVKLFAETGSADLLERLGQGDGGVMDEFLAPAVSAGGGRTEATFFVDGNHSRGKITLSKSGWYSNHGFPTTIKPDEIDEPSHVSTDVSLMSKIVPSPDWFVGIDSFNLCVDGSWLDTITIEVGAPYSVIT